jgi:SAM-dependent methyltransferase
MHLETAREKRNFKKIYQADYLVAQDDPPVADLLDALLLDGNSVVVELGSGDGHFTLPIAKRLRDDGEKGLVFGFDYSDAMIEQLDRSAYDLGVDANLRSWPLTQVKANTLPVNDGKADRVLAVNFIQYLPDPMPIFREIIRILKPGGILVMADWAADDNRDGQKNYDLGASPNDVCSALQAVGIGIHVHLGLKGYRWVIRAIKPTSRSEVNR